MTALTTSALPVGRRGFGRFAEIVSQTFAALGQARRMMIAYERMSRMSDSELAYAGIRREDIPQVVATIR
ncbi:hypothetical protein GCM10007301_04220 [Azorhizobium oxalatiphilum]|uniref:DUF1127 domain-containing protein n=1 Tax=Azorhizobium oxalatiphilum TaxID=980631 RepID=A0A917BJ57_9HYPH|nr:DUF1127 domain-containing protein [Azorhizobium oxalatiphilum]GGF48080.1 hypothetical protein GCM10007301_04220 [Azorhizobium oxalatiphilum]